MTDRHWSASEIGLVLTIAGIATWLAAPGWRTGGRGTMEADGYAGGTLAVGSTHC
jgi:hypothetical protein